MSLVGIKDHKIIERYIAESGLSDSTKHNLQHVLCTALARPTFFECAASLCFLTGRIPTLTSTLQDRAEFSADVQNRNYLELNPNLNLKNGALAVVGKIFESSGQIDLAHMGVVLNCSEEDSPLIFSKIGRDRVTIAPANLLEAAYTPLYLTQVAARHNLSASETVVFLQQQAGKGFMLTTSYFDVGIV